MTITQISYPIARPFEIRFYDLTRTISQDMIVYTGDPRPEFAAHSTIEKDGVNVTKITLGSHTGTHVDAQRHFLPGGNSIDREPLDKFIGDAAIIDLSSKAGQGITAGDLDDAAKNVTKNNDIVLIYTGTGDSPDNYTYLEVAAAEWIVKHGVKCVGTDTLSIEKYGRKGAPAHKILLSSDVGIIENLNSNLGQFAGRRGMFLMCLPLPIKGIDASPARAILFETSRVD